MLKDADWWNMLATSHNSAGLPANLLTSFLHASLCLCLGQFGKGCRKERRSSEKQADDGFLDEKNSKRSSLLKNK